MAVAKPLDEIKKTVSSPIRLKRSALMIVTNVILVIAVIIVAIPFIYMISASFKPQYEIFTFPVQILPDTFYFENYQVLFNETLYIRWFFNTLFVAASRTLLSLFLCTPGWLCLCQI